MLSVSEATMLESPSIATASSIASSNSEQSLVLTSTVEFCNALTTLLADPPTFFPLVGEIQAPTHTVIQFGCLNLPSHRC